MGLKFGNDVSRSLSASGRSFAGPVFRKKAPLTDADLNLVWSIHTEEQKKLIQSGMPSGFLSDPSTVTDDYLFNPLWSNRFKFGRVEPVTGVHQEPEQSPILFANVNGWILPITGSGLADDVSNLVDLYPPPETNSRIDFVFLEAWAARISANPSTVNKPSASTVWKYGNVRFGGTNLPDDIADPEINYPTTGRIQIQYRLRVHGGGSGLGSSLALEAHPDGLGDPYVFGQATATSPVSSLGPFVNMGAELGDSGLWRTGDGNPNNNLGTIDGYTYAIPVCAVFRRGSNPYVAVTTSGNPTQNGGFCRTPSARVSPNPTSKYLQQMYLGDDVSSTDTVWPVNNISNSGLDDALHPFPNVFLTVGSETVSVTSVNQNDGTISVVRGRNGSASVGHKAGSPLAFFNTRPDGLYSDQIHPNDVMDLRHCVNNMEWDYNRLLQSAVSSLLSGKLRTTWKKSSGGDTYGPVVHNVDFMKSGGVSPVPNYAFPVDGPDGIRTVWSDSASIQRDVTILLDNDATQDNGFVDGTFSTDVAWDVSPGFHASGFMNGADNKWRNGSVILLYTGGSSGNEGVRGTFRNAGDRAVRPITPAEFWKSDLNKTEDGDQNPVTIRFVGQRTFDPPPPGLTGVVASGFKSYAERHAGPIYPRASDSFRTPFLFLGGVVNSLLKVTVDSTNLVNPDPSVVFEIDVGVDFDTVGTWYSLEDGQIANDPASVTQPLLAGTRTLYGMITKNGSDPSGTQSELYLVLYGDPDSLDNNGGFVICGAGTQGIGVTATNSTSLVLRPLRMNFTEFDTATGNQLTAEVRSQYTFCDDLSSYASRTADVAVVLTDMASYKWGRTALGYGADDVNPSDTYDLSLPYESSETAIQNKMVLSLSFQYNPGRSAVSKVPDAVSRFARIGSSPSDGKYLRQSLASRDPSFPGQTGAPSNEIHWKPDHVQLWNRLPSLGFQAPRAPSYGGRVVGFTEQDREAELFHDSGSKTLIFRPFRSRLMTLPKVTFANYLGGNSLMGGYEYPTVPTNAKDELSIFTGTSTTGKATTFAVPQEYMPRFGRQNIPYYKDIGENPKTFLQGINHLFRDSSDQSSPVFNIVGGYSNTVDSPGVNHMLFITGISAPGTVKYGKAGTTPSGTNDQPYIGARSTVDINPDVTYAQEIINTLANVNSSDFGRGLRGIQLPPFYGIARLYGVYDSRDFVTKGGRTISTVDRWSPDSDPAPNLLKEDVDQQTLFILQGGAKDRTLSGDDHTYIIPENVLDLTRCLSWSGLSDPEKDFSQFQFVVVCSVFGFSRGWINKNNYVLIRRVNGLGQENTDSVSTPEIESVPMVIPCAAGYNEQFYTAYNRTVYQGDPYMSHDGDSTVTSDYSTRYGQISIPNQYAVRTPIQQFDANGEFVPQTPNKRVYQILSCVDFHTTMGTGKVGGQLFAGTCLDIGYTNNKDGAPLRRPDASDSIQWGTRCRAFTTSQNGSGSPHAAISIQFNKQCPRFMEQGDGYANVNIEIPSVGINETIWFASTPGDLISDGVSPNNIVKIEELSRSYLSSVVTSITSSIQPGSFYTANVDVPHAQVGDDVVVTFLGNQNNRLFARGYVQSENNVRILVANTWGAHGPGLLDGVGGFASTFKSITATTNGTTIQSGELKFYGDYSFDGVNSLDAALAVFSTSSPVSGDLLVFAGTSIDKVGIWIYNTGSSPFTFTVDTFFRIQIFQADSVGSFTINLTDAELKVSALTKPTSGFDSAGDGLRTIVNFATVINQHEVLNSYIGADISGLLTATLYSQFPGEFGNSIKVSLRHSQTDFYRNTPLNQVWTLTDPKQPSVPLGGYAAMAAFSSVYTSNMLGGVDIPVNAGGGSSQISMTGITERLPLGVLLQDSDFICENPLNDTSSATRSYAVGPRPVQSVIPLTGNGEEFSRFLGAPGELLVGSDGWVSVANFGAWTQSNPTGTRVFRVNRGGPLFLLSGDNPGGPIEWVSDSIPPSNQPVLKGGILVCRAMLVRSYYEEANPDLGHIQTNFGNEIQLVVVTSGIIGTDTTTRDGLTLSGAISPAGYGEGYCAADRYRIPGRPMLRSFTTTAPDADVPLAVYPDVQR